MRKAGWTRREALTGGSAALSTSVFGLSRLGHAAIVAPLTMQNVLDRMRTRINGPWREGGVDHIVAGSANMEVRGIGTAMMGTWDVFKEAVAQGLNLVVTHEPTFWSHPDIVADLQNDPLYKRKLAYINDHQLISYHLHDHWHALRPIDGINLGEAEQLGWTAYRDPANQRMYTMPHTRSLLEFSKDVQTKMGARTMRVVGDPRLPVRRVYESFGNCGAASGIPFLDSDADVLVIGETQDWDLIAYVQDLVATGGKKALVVCGHVRSEMFGMQACADWLRGFVPEVPVRFLNTVEPYWNLHHPVSEINPKV